MSGIINHAERILSWHHAHDRLRETVLNPGVSEAELVAFEERLGWRLPEEARALYRWRNGTDPKSTGVLDDLCFLPGFCLLTLEESLNEMRLQARLGQHHPELADAAWSPRWLPILGCRGDFVILDCTNGGREAPVRLARGEWWTRCGRRHR